jgi:D-alanine-D-alanine ligase
MRIGITYDLKSDYIAAGLNSEQAAEFDQIETIIGIEQALLKAGHTTERIGNLNSLLKELIAGNSWDMVFNICEGLYGIGREAQVPAILDAWCIPYVFSDPMVLSLTLNKGMTKRVIRDIGLNTPSFVILETQQDIGSIDLPYPLFVKPNAEGTGKGISDKSKVNNRTELEAISKILFGKYKQPLLVETFLPGREFTVGIVGTGRKAKAIGTMEVIFGPNASSAVYSYYNKSNYHEMMDYAVPEKSVSDECEILALSAWRGLGCRDGGRIDVRYDKEGIVSFIEVNPLAGLNPVDSDLPIIGYKHGISYNELIAMILESAIERVVKKQDHNCY